jgi:tRNA pseudouridine(55) synthase
MGLGLFWKPQGVGSQDFLRSLASVYVPKEKKKKGRSQIGHSGTLDPFAEGVLCVGWGEGTKILAPIFGLNKTYIAGLVLGATTETLDPTSEIKLPDGELQTKVLSSLEEFLMNPTLRQEFLNKNLGTQLQIPPLYSSIKIMGQRSYNRARSGDAQLESDLVLKAREVTVFSAQDLGVESDGVWKVRLTVSSGTYIRALARDWSQRLVGYPGFLKSLVRTGVGNWFLDGPGAERMLTIADLKPEFEVAYLNTQESQKMRVSGLIPRTLNLVGARKSLFVCDNSQMPLAWSDVGQTSQVSRLFNENPLS